MAIFTDLSSDNALVCTKEHRADCGVGTVWFVLLSDGYLIDCGTRGQARAHILADIINAAGPEKLGQVSLRGWVGNSR